MTHLSFIIITWNSNGYLNTCFNSIIDKCKSVRLDYEVIVIDNGSTDNSKSLIEHYLFSKPDTFHLISLDANKGTTYPRNLGLKQAQGKYICVLDSDTELMQGDLRAVLNVLEEQQDIGIVAPKLLLEDGSVQNSVKRFPTFWHKLMKLPKVLLGLKTPNMDFYQEFPFLKEQEVDSAISACWFFRKDLIDLVGFFDEKIFYSPEDLDYCIRVRKAGKKIIFSPKMVVLHHTQQISHKKPFSKISLCHFWGLIYYFRKHGGWFSSPVN